jgi:hypothetical protein
MIREETVSFKEADDQSFGNHPNQEFVVSSSSNGVVQDISDTSDI